MIKRCSVFHCVWGFGKECRVLLYLDFICCSFSLAARESCQLSLAAHLGYPERVQEAEEAWTLRPASRRGGPGSPWLNVVLLQSQHPCLSLLSPSLSQEDWMGCAPSLCPQVLSQRGTRQLLAHARRGVWLRAQLRVSRKGPSRWS